MARIASDWCLDDTFRGWRLSVNQCLIGLLDLPAFELTTQVFQRVLGLGHYDQARRGSVQTMYNPWAPGIANCQFWIASQKGIDQGALLMTVSGVDDHPCWFVHHQKIVVLVNYVQGNNLRDWLIRGRRQAHYHTGTWRH
jgi:hypothetical protein